jgi:hypothetical protein
LKKLLVVAYYFPPSGGPGVQRVLKHIRFLKEFGWEPTVLTVADADYPAIDESLINEVPQDIKVYKTKIFEPYKAYRKLMGIPEGGAVDVNNIKPDDAKLSLKEKIVEFIRATFFIPDARSFWRYTAKKEIAEILKNESFDAVYSSSPPYTCSLIAKAIKKKTGLPWVAGFRDPWTGFISSPKRWFLPAYIDRRMERTVFEQADAVEAAWQGIIKDAIGKYPHLNNSKFYHVPNGYDPADYPQKEQTRPNQRFTLTYTGSLYGRRNPESLFKAIQKLIDEKKINPEKFLLRFVGRFGGEIHQMFDKVSFNNSLEIIGYLPHHESTKHLMSSDMLLLIVDESKESKEIVPGKVYEYIGTKKPVFAIAPKQSAIEELIGETESGSVERHENINGLAYNFLRYYTDFHSGKAIYYPKDKKIEKYTRRNATKRLAQLLDKLNDKESKKISDI